MSVTRPTAWARSCVQAGVVFGVTRIEPGSILSKSFGDKTTLAGAVTVPELTAKPPSLSLDSSFRTWVSLNLTAGNLLAEELRSARASALGGMQACDEQAVGEREHRIV